MLFSPLEQPAAPLGHAGLHSGNVEHAAREALADELLGNELVVLLEVGDLGGVEELHRVLEALGGVAHHVEERALVLAHHEGDEVRPRRAHALDAQLVGALDLDEPL